jgi:signal transduction histidine kinase/ActR/RegA family two-component response regulator
LGSTVLQRATGDRRAWTTARLLLAGLFTRLLAALLLAGTAAYAQSGAQAPREAPASRGSPALRDPAAPRDVATPRDTPGSRETQPPRETQVLRYGMLAELPPFQLWPAGAEPGGADLALLRELAARLQLQLRPVRYASYHVLEADLRAGRIDIASGIARGDAQAEARRPDALALTAPYWTVRRALVTRRDAPSAALTPDMAGRIVAVVMAQPSEDDADRLFPLATRTIVQTARQSLSEVVSGRADVALEALPVVQELIRQHDELATLHVARSMELPSGALHLALPAARKALAQRLSQEIEALGPRAVDALVRRWSAAPPPSGTTAFAPDARERALLAGAPAPVVAVLGSHRPFVFMTGDATPAGLSVDVLRAVFDRLGWTPKAWRAFEPEALAQALRRGEVDWVVGLDESAQFDDVLRFVGPFFEQPVMIIGRRDAVLLDLGQLHGRRLALPPTHFARVWLDARHPAIDLVPCAQLAACVDAVEAGRADATLADVIGAATLLADRPRAAVQMMGAVPELRSQLSLALSTRHAALAPLVQRALDATVAEDLPALKQRWFSQPTPDSVLREVILRWAPPLAAALGLLLAAWWWHSRRLKREVRRRQHAQALAERASQASGRFITFLAHEVRNSLHSVIAGTELLYWARDIQPSVAAGLRESARSTLTLLNNLLDRDRLEAGRLALHLESAHLDPVLRSVALEMGPAAQSRQLSLRYRPAAWDPLLRMDALRVQQVVRNLVANAIKYCDRGEICIEWHCAPEGGGTGADLPGEPGGEQRGERGDERGSERDSERGSERDGERVGERVGDRGSGAGADGPADWRHVAPRGTPRRAAGALVRITVRDQGPGMSAEDQAHLFEPFFVGGERGALGARTGLGLVLSRDIARLMGGDLTVDSMPGVGTAITMAWTADVEPEPEADGAPQVLAGAEGGRRVLVVEDAEVYAMLLEHALTVQGCRVTVAGSVDAAESALAREPFDLVLTDLHLADGGAPRVIAAVNAAGAAGAPPPTLVVMSAELGDADVQALRDAGADLVLAKASDATLFVRQLLKHPVLRGAAKEMA